MASNNNTLPLGYIARNVPGDYDGSTALPLKAHENFSIALAGGASKVAAYRATGRKGACPADAASKLSRYPHIQRRVAFLREERGRAITTENVFDGFVHAVESAMDDIASLVKLCEHAGLPREAAAARNALQSLAGRTVMHRENLAKADRRASVSNHRVLESLEVFQ